MSVVKTERLLEVGIVLCLATLAWAVVDTFHDKVVVAGDRAPEFSITTDAGRTITRDDFGGKLLVLNFWATWCPPCLEELPSLNEFQKNFGSDVVVLGVSVDQNTQAYRNFLNRSKVAFQTARDPEARISADYGTFKFPETYIISRDGRVVEKVVGATNWTDPNMISRVKALLGT